MTSARVREPVVVAINITPSINSTTIPPEHSMRMHPGRRELIPPPPQIDQPRQSLSVSTTPLPQLVPDVSTQHPGNQRSTIGEAKNSRCRTLYLHYTYHYHYDYQYHYHHHHQYIIITTAYCIYLPHYPHPSSQIPFHLPIFLYTYILLSIYLPISIYLHIYLSATNTTTLIAVS
jgi:hypothetical protein